MDNFVRPLHLAANPYYYDYIHSIRIAEAGSVLLMAGAGQVMNGIARGEFLVEQDGRDTFMFHFIRLEEVTHWKDGEKIRDLPDIFVRAVRESGCFAFRREVPSRPKIEDEAPCYMFKERYLLERDPLDFACSLAKYNLYYITESRELSVSERIYYPITPDSAVCLAQVRRSGVEL